MKIRDDDCDDLFGVGNTLHVYTGNKHMTGGGGEGFARLYDDMNTLVSMATKVNAHIFQGTEISVSI